MRQTLLIMYNTSLSSRSSFCRPIRPWFRPLIFLLCLLFAVNAYSQNNGDDLRVVLIRHGEKPKLGSGLSCKGINRANALPSVLKEKIGIPSLIYVPSVAGSDAAKHSRMSQTITPFAEKYHLSINSNYRVNDLNAVAKDILKQKGTVLVVWEHKGLSDLAGRLGVKEKLHWSDSDFDSIWIITFSKKGKARFYTDHEALHPATKCAF